MIRMRKFKTYLAGPIGVIPTKESIQWRDYITKKLDKFEIESLNPMGNNGGDRLSKDRENLRLANLTGDVNFIRDFVSNKVIPPDLQMVKDADFLTVYIPKDDGYEICGTYGEVTLAFYLNKFVYVVTDRSTNPVKLPNWLIGCSTAIFKSWSEYLKYINKEWGKESGRRWLIS